MGVIKDTLEENYVFFIRELARIEEEIAGSPKGSISEKKIAGKVYYYHQWRDKGSVKSVSLGTSPPEELVDAITRRKLLEKQRKDVLENLKTIEKAVDGLVATADEILRVFHQNGVNVTLVGSFCMPVYKDMFKFNLPTIKTQDVDFLVSVPYKGGSADIELLLKPLGFSLHFNADGSTFFSNGTYKVEFLTPETGKGKEGPVNIDPLKIKVTPLRFLQMLDGHIEDVDKGDYRYSVPTPYVYAFHKILIAPRRRSPSKSMKDLLQAESILREVLKRSAMADKAMEYLDTLPEKWIGTIKDFMKEKSLVYNKNHTDTSSSREESSTSGGGPSPGHFSH